MSSSSFLCRSIQIGWDGISSHENTRHALLHLPPQIRLSMLTTWSYEILNTEHLSWANINRHTGVITLVPFGTNTSPMYSVLLATHKVNRIGGSTLKLSMLFACSSIHCQWQATNMHTTQSSHCNSSSIW